MGAAGSELEKALGDQFPEGERYFGFENFGNTCYSNSVLQTTPDHDLDFEEEDEVDVANPEAQDFELLFHYVIQKLAQMLSRLIKIAEEFNAVVYMTNQAIANLGGGLFISDPKKPPGGHVLAHAATIRLKFRKGKGD